MTEDQRRAEDDLGAPRRLSQVAEEVFSSCSIPWEIINVRVRTIYYRHPMAPDVSELGVAEIERLRRFGVPRSYDGGDARDVRQALEFRRGRALQDRGFPANNSVR